jgi:FkbM family methyltransferase
MDASSYTFGTIGRLVRKKEQEVLLKALTHSGLEKCCAVIIGSGPRLDCLEALAERLGVRERVTFTGHVHQAFRYLSAFDVFVLPSGEKEAFGLVLLEAMMARIPVISTDAKGPREVVGDSGLLFRHGDAADLSRKMIELRNAGEEEVFRIVERANDRLISDYHAGCFRHRFWELPPVKQIESARPDSVFMELLSTFYRYRSLPRIIRHSIYRKLRRRGVTPSEEFEIDFFGLQYKGNVKNQIDADVFFYGGFEKTMLFFLRDVMAIAPGTFIDIGANVGNHSLFMSRYAEHVHSFEPFRPVLDKMIYQMKANQVENITVHNVALGNEPGVMQFYAPPEESLGGGSFLESVARKHGERPVVDLPVVCGDEYFACQGIDGFSAIKIDVEGFEVPVLKGLVLTLKRVRPLIIMEVTHGASDFINTTTDIQAYLPGDYALFRFENRDDRLFSNQGRRRKRTGRYRLYPVSEKVHKKRADVVACPREWLEKLPRTNRGMRVH